MTRKPRQQSTTPLYVTINVTDLEEDGVITLSRATPSVGAAITATLTDPDGAVTSLTWQWSKSDTETGSFTNITTATSDSYTPVTADVGKWLKATASYTDRRGSGKNADQTATNAVDDTPHKVPAFATETITLTVAENAPVGHVRPPCQPPTRMATRFTTPFPARTATTPHSEPHST